MTATETGIRDKLHSSGNPYILDDHDTNTDEYVHFYFLAEQEGKERVHDCTLYTLRLQHESEIMEVAEARAVERFPQYRHYRESEDVDSELEEKVGLFMAEVILELEEEEAIKVSEHVEEDWNAESGIGLDAGLNVERITPAVIAKFIEDFRNSSLQLDETLYSFTTAQDQ